MLKWVNNYINKVLQECKWQEIVYGNNMQFSTKQKEVQFEEKTNKGLFVDRLFNISNKYRDILDEGKRLFPFKIIDEGMISGCKLKLIYFRKG